MTKETPPEILLRLLTLAEAHEMPAREMVVLGMEASELGKSEMEVHLTTDPRLADYPTVER